MTSQLNRYNITVHCDQRMRGGPCTRARLFWPDTPTVYKSADKPAKDVDEMNMEKLKVE